MSLKGPCDKDWVTTSLWCYGEAMGPLGGGCGLLGESYVCRVLLFERSLPLCVFISLPPMRLALGSTLALCHSDLPCHKPQSKRAKQLWAETPGIVSASCPSEGKLTGLHRMLSYL